MVQKSAPHHFADHQTLGLILRIGLGALFIAGGWNKLYQLFDPALQQFILNSYLGTHGYINAFFIGFLFESNGAVLTPWAFMAALSTFELLTGIMLVLGVMVRPIALIYGFLLWAFVIALPVTTTPGVTSESVTFTSPAILVQIRDIGLSGLMFVLFNLGSGRWSMDHKFLGTIGRGTSVTWDSLGLLLRLSLAAPLIVGGVFGGMADIQSFATPGFILVLTGFVILGGNGARLAGGILIGILLWYMAQKIGIDKTLIANLNGIKRELAFLGGGIVLLLKGGGNLYTITDITRRMRSMIPAHSPQT